MLPTRRSTLFIGAAAAAAAFGLSRPLAFIPPAHAQTTPPPSPQFHKYKVGDVEVTALYDGIWEKPHDPAFISNASMDEVRDAMTAAGLPRDFVSIPLTVSVIRAGDRLIMIDAGSGGQWQPHAGRLAANMTSADIDPARIDTILVSHFHPDHIYGLMLKGSNAPVFPQAEIVVSGTEYRWWMDPSRVAQLPEDRKPLGRRIQAVFPGWSNIRQVDGEVEVAPGIRMVAVPGHTPGHVAFALTSGGSSLLLSNDTFYVPALVVAHPGWHGAYDQNGPLAEVSRRRLMDQVVTDGLLVTGAHFPFPGPGHIRKDGNTFAYVPAAV